ncbi:MAG: hypothetical protein N3B21_05370 [Clostridia bacterium]|nr:hypothetical protein [Clostridia bacterium]
MFIGKKINDERITQTKHKIASEAFGIMFLALTIIVFVKSIVLEMPTKEYFTEFILYMGISLYVFIRMIMSSVYAVNIQNSNQKNKLKIVIISDIVFLLSIGAIQYSQSGLNIVFLLFAGITYFAAFYGLLWLSGKITELRNKTDDNA